MSVNLENQNAFAYPKRITWDQKITSVERHRFTEEIMVDRIKFTYKDGIKIFHQIISENEEIKNAYENFLVNKYKTLSNCINETLLIYSGVDKFKKEIFFIIKNSGTRARTLASFYSFSIDSKSNINPLKKETLKLVDNFLGSGFYPFMQVNSDVVDNFNSNQDYENPKIKHQLNIKIYSNIIDIWNEANMMLTIENSNANYHADELTDQPYANEENFYKINKYFKSIMSFLGLWEWNKLNINNELESSFNPCHTTLLPDDISNFSNKSIKNARSQIETNL